MGPQHIAAENKTSTEQTGRSPRLQWGRSTSLRKTRLNAIMQQIETIGFNGAAAHRCGKRRFREEEPLVGAGFNGAAAHRCGKPGGPLGFPTPAHWGFNGAAAHRCGKPRMYRGCLALRVASMGPQHIAAENQSTSPASTKSLSGASMGPQHIAAENNVAVNASVSGRGASMGPQHIAAENCNSHQRCSPKSTLQWGRSTSLRKTRISSSEMRPSRALQWGRSTSLRKTCSQMARREIRVAGFNGAAAHRCGKPPSARSISRVARGFNGAAAHRCGKLRVARLWS